MTFNDVGALVVSGCCFITMLLVVVSPLLWFGRRRKRYERW